MEPDRLGLNSIPSIIISWISGGKINKPFCTSVSLSVNDINNTHLVGLTEGLKQLKIVADIHQVLRNTQINTFSFKVLPIYLFYFPASTAKTPNTFVVVSLDSPVLNIDTLGISVWELCLQLVGEVMKNAHTVLCGLRKQDMNLDHTHTDIPLQV